MTKSAFPVAIAVVFAFVWCASAHAEGATETVDAVSPADPVIVSSGLTADLKCGFVADPLGCYKTKIACGDSGCVKSPTSLQPLDLNSSVLSGHDGFYFYGGCCGTKSCGLFGMSRCGCGPPLGSSICSG